MSDYRRFNDSDMDQARSIDIREIGEQNGLSFTKQGNYDRCNEHDSLVLKGQSFYWNSQNKKGNGGLSFAMEVLDMNFHDSMTMLIDGEYEEYNKKDLQKNNNSTFMYDNDERYPNKVIDYLTKERGIDKKLVDWTIKTGVVAEDNKSNAVFKWNRGR